MARMGRRAPNAIALVNFLLSKPVVTSVEIVSKLNISKQTAYTLIKELRTAGILREKTGFKRNRVFIFTEYFNLFNR